VAIKEVPNAVLLQKLGGKGMEGLERELKICQMFKHRNIVRWYDFTRSVNNNYLIFEYCAGGDLRSFLKEKRCLNEFTTQRFMK
jgi:serine/threonine protein kinase